MQRPNLVRWALGTESAPLAGHQTDCPRGFIESSCTAMYPERRCNGIETPVQSHGMAFAWEGMRCMRSGVRCSVRGTSSQGCRTACNDRGNPLQRSRNGARIRRNGPQGAAALAAEPRQRQSIHVGRHRVSEDVLVVLPATKVTVPCVFRRTYYAERVIVAYLLPRDTHDWNSCKL